MTNSITPPPNLVRQWIDEPQYMTEDQLGKRMYMISLNEVKFREIISKASQYGADQELEACCDTLQRHAHWDLAVCELMADRRPQPPNLKEEALKQLDEISACFRVTYMSDIVCDKIRRALEALDD